MKHTGGRPSYGSEKPYIGVKGPHKSEGSKKVKRSHGNEGKGTHWVDFTVYLACLIQAYVSSESTISRLSFSPQAHQMELQFQYHHFVKSDQNQYVVAPLWIAGLASQESATQTNLNIFSQYYLIC